MSTETEIVQKHVEYSPICAVCGHPIEVHDYSGEKLSETHIVDLAVFVLEGDASLPHILEVHGDCLPGLRDTLICKNKGWKWV